MYINLMISKNKNFYIKLWLLLITFLVALTILIGGLTRLTDSGLSITRWDLFSGIIPPLNTEDWKKYFSLYKEIPEYKLLNFAMTLEEFKVIYWWEFAHRLLGRIIGLFYLIPLIYFTWNKMIKKENLISFYMIFILIFFQGVMGWYMVKSGLVDKTDVSHYRLSLHLTLAFIIYILLLWNFLKIHNQKDLSSINNLPSFLPVIFLTSIILQISLGALVSGLDAGQIYRSWPLMGDNYFPNDSTFHELFTLKSLETPSLVQFMHRNVAYFILFLLIYICFLIFRNNKFYHLKKITLLIFVILLFQIFLGILTILSGAQIIIASMHQVGSIFLVTVSLILVFKNSKIS